MTEENQEKTAFITSQGLYCYKVMPFGLKNAGATYQRLVNKMFSKQIGRNMEVYVDDMLVKSKEELTHLDDLKETFTTFRQYQMKLNPSKWCSLRKVFGIHGVLERNRSKLGEGASHPQHEVTQDRQRSPKNHGEDRGI